MDPKAVEKANSRLRVAQNQLGECEKAGDHATFSDHWYLFLVAAKNVYTQLEQGAKLSAQSRQWFGAIKNERKTDPLLQYLFQARDDDEHGLEAVLEYVSGGIMIGPKAAPNSSRDFNIELETIPGRASFKVSPNDGKPVGIKVTSPYSRLTSVIARGNIIYSPPTEHLGVPIENNLPIHVGKLALTYLSSLVADARSRCA